MFAAAVQASIYIRLLYPRADQPSTGGFSRSDGLSRHYRQDRACGLAALNRENAIVAPTIRSGLPISVAPPRQTTQVFPAGAQPFTTEAGFIAPQAFNPTPMKTVKKANSYATFSF